MNEAEASEYDVALFDLCLPGLDGLSLMKKARQIRPDMSSIMITGRGDMGAAIQALRLGAVDFLLKPINYHELGAALEKGLQAQSLRKDPRTDPASIQTLTSYDGDVSEQLIGESQHTIRVRQQIELAVSANCQTVLITGETGTGKEVVARCIHDKAFGQDRPFVAVNCAALPDSLVESELFGHTKGAFTGATAERAGFFELADDGTLFLDEIADLSLGAQATILRILETRSFRRVGGSKEISVSIKVVAASNAPLEELVARRTFRRDLLYRLDVFRIALLPLRERPKDILPLATYFLDAYASARGLQLEGFSPEAQTLLLDYTYPGNARELRNIVERAAIACRSGLIVPDHFDFRSSSPIAPPPDMAPSSDVPTDDEKARILRALEEKRWNRREAAKALQMPYSTLRYKMQRFGIN